MTQDEFNKQYGEVRQVLGKFKHECEIILAAKETAEQAYQRGLDEAWEAARKIVCRHTTWGGYTQEELKECFKKNYCQDVMEKYSASEALSKIREYEAKKKAEDEAIKVGDEMASLEEPTVNVVVSSVIDAYHFSGFCGSMSGVFLLKDWRKTGRHFPQIAEVLGEIANGKSAD
jgi:hypothetical protein